MPFSRSHNRQHLLFISINDPISHTQLFPYFFQAQDFTSIELRELPLTNFIKGNHPYKRNTVDAICLQTWFDLKAEELKQLLTTIRTTWPMAKLAYLDWFAPADLRYAETLNNYVVAYVKKQLLRDISQYNQSTLGDTNLTDYYARRFQLNELEVNFKVPVEFFEKIILGPNFAFSDYMLPHFMGAPPPDNDRPIDLHARITVSGSEWYSRMRQEAVDKVIALEKTLQVTCRGKVSRKKFIQELLQSKLCFSPFGYGEICWRDFEAMFTGSLLLKPDVSHLSCDPAIFVPYETYVPLNWDLSDFDEKVNHYLNNKKARQAITHNAFNYLHQYFRNKHFIQHTQSLFHRLNLDTDSLARQNSSPQG